MYTLSQINKTFNALDACTLKYLTLNYLIYKMQYRQQKTVHSLHNASIEKAKTLQELNAFSLQDNARLFFGKYTQTLTFFAGTFRRG